MISSNTKLNHFAKIFEIFTQKNYRNFFVKNNPGAVPDTSLHTRSTPVDTLEPCLHTLLYPRTKLEPPLSR